MIPEAVAKRWGPMWPAGHCPERPSWRMESGWPTATAVRSDGVRAPVPILGHDPAAPEKAMLDMSEVERIDREHPLPRPPAMPGQVWLRADGREHLVGGGGDVAPDLLLLEFVALLAGPSPWGRDVPWCGP